MDADDDDVFATSLIDRYGAHPYNLENLCLAEFAVNYDVVPGKKKAAVSCDLGPTSTAGGKKIKLRNELGYMQKCKIPAILHTKRFRVANEPERYYHAKLILYYPWFTEDSLIDGYTSYYLSYKAKKEIVLENSELFNEDCEAFDVDIDNLDSYNDSMWDMVALTVAEDDSLTTKLGFSTIQEHVENKQISAGNVSSSKTLPSDALAKLYTLAVGKQVMNFQSYCEYIRGLNGEQKKIVMFNCHWCKAYIHRY